MKMRAYTMGLVFAFAGILNAEDTAKCPWKLATGNWRLSDDTGYWADIVWRSAGDGHALLGTYEDKDGGRYTELVGWRPDKKVLVATGYGSKGSYWEVEFTTVTESMIKGNIVDRRPDGSTFKGTWQVTKESEDSFLTLFTGTDGDGNQVRINGSFKRTK